MSLSPASESLLTVIRCSCKTNCESRRCNCRKHGPECSIACGECRGISCSNVGEDKNNEDFLMISHYVKNYLSYVLVDPKCITPWACSESWNKTDSLQA